MKFSAGCSHHHLSSSESDPYQTDEDSDYNPDIENINEHRLKTNLESPQNTGDASSSTDNEVHSM